MATLEKHITVHRGDTFSFTFEFEEAPTDFACHFTAYTTNGVHSNDNVLFKCELGDGVTKVSDTAYTVRVAPAKTRQTPGAYPYVFNIAYNDDIYTLLDGTFIILP